MRILGIDYGRAKVGIALGINGFSEPLNVIRYKDIKILSDRIKLIIEKEKIEKIVVGISEGQMAQETKEFVKAIQPFIQSTIILSDETLSSQDAQRMSREAGIGRTKRREMEDAYAASIMLQGYLDSN